jgi:predicted SAM-dependent methyltransferase
VEAAVSRLNIGCGSVRPDDWDNLDLDDWDIRQPRGGANQYDYAVCSFMLQELDFHELPGALRNLRAVLKPGGVLRVLVPNIEAAIFAFRARDEEWFPQDDRTGGLDAKFCTYVTWYGTCRSVFTRRYLEQLLVGAHFDAWAEVGFGQSQLSDRTVVALDSRPKEALIFEARK